MADKKNNPKNPQNPLFRKLTRLLSGPVVNYRRQLPRQLKRQQLGYQNFRSASGQQFKKNEYNPYNSLQVNYMANQGRADRYVDFDQMEYTPEIASALDIYADEITTSTLLSPMLSIKCSNEEIKMVLENLYHNVLNVNFNLFGWARTLCKYGDFFLYLDIDEEEGIKYAMGLPGNEVERLEGEDKSNPNYVQYQWNSAGMTLENWQVAHFRILANDKHNPYGTSVLEPARRIWRQLTLLEDAMMAYRIVRSPERRVFYIDVGNISPPDIEQYMQRVMTQMKRNQIVDKDTGRIDLRYNPMSIEEDYFIPVRAGQSSRVETLPGGTYTGDIDDVKYLRDKLFSALKIPASYLSRGEGADEDKTTLAQKDIRFARTIQRLQSSVVSELEKIAIVHLFTLGYRGKDLVSFQLALNNPSKLAELQELEHWRTRFEVASSATEGFFSRRWVAENLFNVTEEEFLRMQRETFYDRKFDATVEKAVEEIAAPAEGLGPEGGGDLGLGGGGDLGLGGEEELGPEADDELAGAEEAPEEEGGPLLAVPAGEAPGHRDETYVRKDGSQTTSKSKGKWYKPVKHRGGDRRPHGAYERHLKGLSHMEITKNTSRNVSKGSDELFGLKKLGYGIPENRTRTILESNYREEEDKLFETKYEIKKLIESLELKDNEA
tara:strand:- start:580 stop:2568 length:1989 start_codon:yes stop_codon:yes gene_type:complete